MKKKPINNVFNAFVEVIIGLSIMLLIASIFSKCTDKKPNRQMVEMLSTHSDKGFVTEQNGLIIVKR